MCRELLDWIGDQFREQLDAIANTIEQIVRNDPNQPFYLGVTAVNVTAPLATLSPVSDSLDRIEIQNHHALTVNQAIEYLPGVAVDLTRYLTSDVAEVQ